MNGFLKKAAIFALVMAVVAAGGWYGRKLYKKATERRLVAEARERLAQHDVRNASLCLQRALQVNPISLEASILTAEMLDLTGSPAAVTWRMRAALLDTNTVKLRFDWAATALKAQDSRSAAQALSGVAEKDKTSAEYHKLAGTLAWSQTSAVEAENHFIAALKLEPTNQSIVLNLSTIRLASTNETIAGAARVELDGIPTNSPLRMTALRYLLTDAMNHRAYDKALQYGREASGSPAAVFADKLAYLQVLSDAKRPELAAYRTSLEAAAQTNSAQAYALGRWMAQTDGPEKTLSWMRALPETVQTNQPAPLLVADCEIAVKDWKGLLALVDKKDWQEANYFRFALESMAQRGLGNTMDARNAWQKATRASSRHLEAMARLVQIVSSWGWRAEEIELLHEVTTRFPSERWAFDQLFGELHAEGDTKGLADLLSKMHAADPKDARIKNNLALVLLLRKSNVENARKWAQEAYESAPDNPFFATTYAYSLLQQKKIDEAVQAFAALKPEYLQIPSVAAYYGLVQAQAGHKELAATSFKRAEQARILPEEKELVRLAMSTM